MRPIAKDFQMIENSHLDYTNARKSGLVHSIEHLKVLKEKLTDAREVAIEGGISMSVNPVSMLDPENRSPIQIRERLDEWAEESRYSQVNPEDTSSEMKAFSVIYGDFRCVPKYLNQGIDPIISWRLSLGNDSH